MPRKYGYIVVEGPHDVEMVYRLLRPFSLSRVQFKANLDIFFHPLTEYAFPLGGDLMKRIPVPLFLQNDSHLVAVHATTGDSRLIETVEENALAIDHAGLTGVGVMLDADSDKPPSDRYAAIRDGFAQRTFPFPMMPVLFPSPLHGLGPSSCLTTRRRVLWRTSSSNAAAWSIQAYSPRRRPMWTPHLRISRC